MVYNDNDGLLVHQGHAGVIGFNQAVWRSVASRKGKALARSSKLQSDTFSECSSAATRDESNEDTTAMVTEIEEHRVKLVSLVRGIKDLLGVGLHLLLLGFILEGLALVIQQRISFPIALATETQARLTVLCLSVCLLGAIWFSRSLDLVKFHLLKGKKELATGSPFVYARHPLYSTLVLTTPPLVVVLLSDLLFLVPWVLVIVIAHLLVRLEERGLIEEFGKDYERYRKYVPALLPYKGAGGRRYRGEGA